MVKTQRTISINGYPYQVEIVGSGQPTWLFFHGFLGSNEEFADIQPNGTVIYVTLKGFGKEAPLVGADDLTVENQVKDIKVLLEALDVDQVNLVGYSMGARLALSYALAYPESINQLVLESGTAGLADAADREARQTKDERLAQKLITHGMEPFVDMWEALPLFATQNNVTETEQRKVRTQRLNQRPENMAMSLRAFGTGSMPNYWPVLSTLQLPVIIITGERDEKFTKIGVELYENIQGSRHIVIPEVGHNVHLEAVEMFTNTLNQLV